MLCICTLLAATGSAQEGQTTAERAKERRPSPSLHEGGVKAEGEGERSSNARRFKPYDDFEEMGIHSTIPIDKDGRVHWARHGGAPFDDYTFIVSQLQRMNQRHATARTTTTAAQ